MMKLKKRFGVVVLAGTVLSVGAATIPADKQLNPAWVESLTERGHALDLGVAGSSKAGSLKYIGMPVGGIGCGQLYLGGDGKLWLWDIFKSNYRREPPSKQGFLVSSFVLGGHYAHPVAQGEPYSQSNGTEVEQGFAIRTPAGTKTLDRHGFADIRFRGEYPVGKVTYAEKLVLLALADHADDEGVCWPSQEKLSDKTGITRTRVSRLVHSLKQRGLIQIEARKVKG
ncbi:helix-turn-helix domain-containing protein, partial [Pontiella sp.]|uniref:helix-turn-helix domain-containing protein n=1 Tax=Pontiella sp. TaxID=2837462 RepID=UPI003562386C